MQKKNDFDNFLDWMCCRRRDKRPSNSLTWHYSWLLTNANHWQEICIQQGSCNKIVNVNDQLVIGFRPLFNEYPN